LAAAVIAVSGEAVSGQQDADSTAVRDLHREAASAVARTQAYIDSLRAAGALEARAWVPVVDSQGRTAVRVVDVIAQGAIQRESMPAPAAPQVIQARNIRLSFQLIEADGFVDVDPSIAEIVGELRQLFRFEGYRLLDSSLLTGVIPGSNEHPDAANMVRQRLALGSRGTFDLVASIQRSDNAERTRIFVQLVDTYAGQHQDGRIMETSVNVRDGQTIVLGSGRPGAVPFGNAQETALILVMSVDIEPYD
jgi:hypothetical protein